MFYLKKTLDISAAHRLMLSYPSQCQNLHGHNFQVTVFCKNKELDENGMIIDFTEIKRIVNQLDHANLNDVLHFNPTAENIAEWLCKKIPFCYRIEIEETKNNQVAYEL